MERRPILERTSLRDSARRCAFDLHHRTAAGDVYWQEGACWLFRRQELEEWLLPASIVLHQLLMAYVHSACGDPALLALAGVPPRWWAAFAREQLGLSTNLLIRLDLAYDGHGPPQLLECEVEAAGSIFETGFFQLQWFEDLSQAGVLPPGANQCNRLHDALVESFAAVLNPSVPLHVAAAIEDSEDWLQARYLSACASQAGHRVKLADPAGFSSCQSTGLRDASGEQVRQLLLLQRWHHLLRAPAEHSLLPALNGGLKLFAPLWTHLVSSKSCLAGLWQMFPGHPLLLPAWLEPSSTWEPGPGQVRKPLHGHRGEGIVLVPEEGSRVRTSGGDGPPEEAWVGQQFAPQCLAGEAGASGGCRVLSSWLVGGRPVALAMREGPGPVLTGSNCRFVPHLVVP